MGGGALKVEATHLRRLPVPSLDATQWKNLSDLGRRMASAKKAIECEGVLEHIDDVVVSALLGRPASKSDVHRLHQLIIEGISRRGKHNQGNDDH
jgi:hypothetical protein